MYNRISKIIKFHQEICVSNCVSDVEPCVRIVPALPDNNIGDVFVSSCVQQLEPENLVMLAKDKSGRLWHGKFIIIFFLSWHLILVSIVIGAPHAILKIYRVYLGVLCEIQSGASFLPWMVYSGVDPIYF